MSDADASAAFEADYAQVQEAVRAMIEQLQALGANFADLEQRSTASMKQTDAAARNTAAGIAATGEATAATGGRMANFRSVTMGMVHALVELSHWTFLMPNNLGNVGVAAANMLSKFTTAGPQIISAVNNIIPGLKHVLEYVSLTNRALQAMKGELGPLGALMGYFSARAIGASRSMAALGSAAALATSTTVAGMRAVSAAVTSLAGIATAAMSTIGGAALVAFPALLPLSLAILAVVSAFTLLKKAVNVSAGFEATTTSFRSLVGNAELAKTAIADLIAFSDRSGTFDKFQVTEAGRQLVAFGYDAKNLLPILTDVGDLAAGMNKPLIDVANAFGYLKAGQFGNAFSSFRSLGITQKELEGQGLRFDKSGQFKGSVDEAMTAVRAVIQQRFGGSMEDLSKTWNGLWSQLVSQTGNALRAIGEPILEQLKPMLAALVKFIHEMLPLAQMIGQTIAGVLRGINLMFGFKPVIPSERPDREPGTGQEGREGLEGPKVGKMRELGGGGNFNLGLNTTTDPAMATLEENRRHTRLLEQLVAQGQERGRPGRPMAHPFAQEGA